VQRPGFAFRPSRLIPDREVLLPKRCAVRSFGQPADNSRRHNIFENRRRTIVRMLPEVGHHAEGFPEGPERDTDERRFWRRSRAGSTTSPAPAAQLSSSTDPETPRNPREGGRLKDENQNLPKRSFGSAAGNVSLSSADDCCAGLRAKLLPPGCSLRQSPVLLPFSPVRPLRSSYAMSMSRTERRVLRVITERHPVGLSPSRRRTAAVLKLGKANVRPSQL